MSGIYGMVRFDGTPVTRDMLEPMARAMSFWGPDGHGQWCGEAAGLGHLMLHVTPESLHERLPASLSAAPHLVITADARIDNRDELFDALGVPGPGREKTPDSSLILLAYERWGADCVKRLLGDFAFAIWDGRKRILFCARDLFGCKPFVYHSDGKRFVFASDIKGVLARVESPKLNLGLLAASLQFRTRYAEKQFTFFEDIVKLPPAHILVVDSSGLKLSRYWFPEDTPDVRFSSNGEYAEQMRLLFEEAVRCRFRSAFPSGSHLSGGLDSSAVTIMASRIAREHNRTVAAFSWSPATKIAAGTLTESARIDAVCLQEGLNCRHLPPTKESFFEAFRADITTQPTEMLAHELNVQKEAQAMGLRCILSGWGGDEGVTIHGVSYLAEFLAGRQWSVFHEAVRRRLSLADGKPLLAARKLGGIAWEIARAHLPDNVYLLTAPRAYLAYLQPYIKREFASRYERQVQDFRGPAWRSWPRFRESVIRRLEFGHIPKRIEDWAVSGASRHLEYRYPMLDQRLIEFFLGIPPAVSYCGGLKRGLFQAAFSTLLPSTINWQLAKDSPDAREALSNVHLDAHAAWLTHLYSDESDVISRCKPFIDFEKIRRSVEAADREDSIFALEGVRAAFSCAIVIRKYVI